MSPWEKKRRLMRAHSVGKWIIAVTGLSLSTVTTADVTLDGSLGPGGALSGPDYAITADLGRQVGSNLFHSFGRFNIDTGESAIFTGSSFIENVLGRVTGGSPSFIDGLLRTRFENASPNLFLLNPAGVLFGPNASLDVQGSFHVSTADYLKLGDGGRFEATHPEKSVLTTAPPEAFGFLGENPAGIAVQGSLLQVPPGETLSMVGGDIRIADGTLYAPGGRIDMVSVASPGEVLPNAPDLGVASFERLGRIEVSHASSERPLVDPSLPREILGNEIGNVDASGEGGGRIFIRGGEFVADNAFVFADTRGDGEGQGIDIGVTGQVTMRHGAAITADILGSGSGGDLTVKAGSLEMREGAFIGASTSGSGDGGQLLVEAGSLEMRNGASIVADTLGSGSGGDLTVKADKMFLSGDFTGIFALDFGAGSRDLGDINVTTGSLEVRNRAGIHTAPFVQGEGGDVTVTADRVLLSGDGGFLTGISSGGCIFNSCLLGGGGVGNVTVTAGSLEVRNGAGISAQSNTLVAVDDTPIALGITRRGGNVTVIADRVFLSGDGGTRTILVDGEEVTEFFSTGITATGFESTEVFGQLRIDAGNITIQAGSLEVRDGAEISTSFSGNEGQGGNVTVIADRVFLSGDGVNFERFIVPTGIFAEAFGGSAGDVAVTTDNLEVRNGAAISTSTFGGGPGGNVTVEADRVFLSGDGASFAGGGVIGIIGRISPFTGIAALTEGTAGGGNVTVTAADITLQNGGSISAESIGTGLDLEANPEAGRSGTISITATDNFRLLNGGRVSVETAQANAGDIILNVGTLLHLSDQSSITTSAAGGTGKGGDITLNSVFVVLDERSSIIANALDGQAGNILIRILGGGALFQSPDSLIGASNRFGVEGSVVIDAPDTDLTGGLVALPANFLDTAAILPQACAERLGSEVSRLVVRPYEVLPDSPYALRIGLPKAPDAFGERRATRTWDQPPADEVYSVLGDAAPQPLSGRLGCSL